MTFFGMVGERLSEEVTLEWGLNDEKKANIERSGETCRRQKEVQMSWGIFKGQKVGQCG